MKSVGMAQCGLCRPWSSPAAFSWTCGCWPGAQCWWCLAVATCCAQNYGYRLGPCVVKAWSLLQTCWVHKKHQLDLAVSCVTTLMALVACSSHQERTMKHDTRIMCCGTSTVLRAALERHCHGPAICCLTSAPLEMRVCRLYVQLAAAQW